MFGRRVRAVLIIQMERILSDFDQSGVFSIAQRV